MSENGSLIINIIANSIAGPMSGGDRIWIECAKRWIKERDITINVFTTEEGIARGHCYGLNDVNYVLWSSSNFNKFGIYILYFWRLINGCKEAVRLPKFYGKNVILLSSSDFMPDSIPAWILKMRMRTSKWVAAFFLFAPNPFGKESPYRGKLFTRGLFYFISQLPVYWLLRKFADIIWVTNDLDRKYFIEGKRLTSDKVIAVRGGVDAKTPLLVPEPEKKVFDAVFIGRFHPQKGVLELTEIWRYVCEKKPYAKLALIGVGELEDEVKERIQKYRLENNVVLFGFKDGLEKLKIFKKSKIVVHPAIYDSGGMAACEAMACGVPGVSFDLPALRTYYPKGMIKTPCHDLRAFAENVIKLLDDENLYNKTREDATAWAKEWDWDKRAKEILDLMRDHE